MLAILSLIASKQFLKGVYWRQSLENNGKWIHNIEKITDLLAFQVFLIVKWVTISLYKSHCVKYNVDFILSYYHYIRSQSIYE